MQTWILVGTAACKGLWQGKFTFFWLKSGLLLSFRLEKWKTIATFTLTQKPSCFQLEIQLRVLENGLTCQRNTNTYMFPFGYSAIWFFFRLEIPSDKKPKIAPFLLTLGCVLFLIEERWIFSSRRFQMLFIGGEKKKKESLVLSCLSGKVLIVGCMWDASRIWKYPVQPLTCLEIHTE